MLLRTPTTLAKKKIVRISKEKLTSKMLFEQLFKPLKNLKNKDHLRQGSEL